MGFSSETGRPRIAELDGLRGLAALIVVLFHYTTRYDAFYGHRDAPLFSMPRGGMGVPLFMISGFVMLMTISRTKSIADFAVSRFSRLYPAYIAAVILTFGVLSLSGMWPEGRLGLREAAANLTMLHRFAGIRSVDGVYWTLPYELVFYGLIVGLFATRLLARIEIVAAGLLALSLGYWLMLQADAFASFGMAGALVKRGVILLLVFQSVQFFITGMMLHRCWKEGVTAGRLTIVVLAVLTTQIVDEPYRAAVQGGFAAVMALAIWGRLAILRSRPLTALGSVAYTLYLTHQNIGYVVIHALERRGVPSTVAILAAVAVALGCATLLSVAIERPAMRLIRSRYKAFKAGRFVGAQQPAPTQLGTALFSRPDRFAARPNAFDPARPGENG